MGLFSISTLTFIKQYLFFKIFKSSKGKIVKNDLQKKVFTKVLEP